MERNVQLSKFFEKEYSSLCKKVNRRAGSPENAEDVVQEAFHRAIKYWDSFDPNTKQLGAWFNTILNNACKDFKRDEMNYGMCLELDEEQVEGTDDYQIEGDLIARVRALLKEKTGVTKDILDLYYNKGYKTREIVEILDVNNKTVRQSVWRFKEELKEKLEAGV